MPRRRNDPEMTGQDMLEMPLVRFRIPRDVLASFKEKAKWEGKSIAFLVRDALMNWRPEGEGGEKLSEKIDRKMNGPTIQDTHDKLAAFELELRQCFAAIQPSVSALASKLIGMEPTAIQATLERVEARIETMSKWAGEWQKKMTALDEKVTTIEEAVSMLLDEKNETAQKVEELVLGAPKPA